MHGHTRSRQRDRRRRLMALIFLMLPGVVVAGLLAPELVAQAPAQEEPIQIERRPLIDGPPGSVMPPLLVERDFSAESGDVLLDFQDLFKATPLVPAGAHLSNLVAFPQNRGELIPFDDAARRQPDPVFEDLLADPVMPAIQLAGLSPFHPLHNPLPRSNGLRFDDFPGGAGPVFFTPIPEPGTGLLVATGLVLLAALRRPL